jgi:cytidylate kinase
LPSYVKNLSNKNMTLKDKMIDTTVSCVVALDGPSASGKGLIGAMIAEQFSLKYFSSSSVYRALAYLCTSRKADLSDEARVIELSQDADAMNEILRTNIDLQGEELASYTSKIATILEVRQNLTKLLKYIISSTPRIIMEGRDIGTVVAPDADIKIFLTANVNVRAERRYKQLISSGKECIFRDILSMLQERDKRDMERENAPLVQAEDAFLIDSSYLSSQEVLEQIKKYVANR